MRIRRARATHVKKTARYSFFDFKYHVTVVPHGATPGIFPLIYVNVWGSDGDNHKSGDAMRNYIIRKSGKNREWNKFREYLMSNTMGYNLT